MFKNIKRILFILLVCMLAVFLLERSTSNSSNQEEAAEQNPIPSNPYLSELYSYKGSYKTYEDDAYTSVNGVDISSHQGTIDWAALKESGISFVMIRVGYRGYQTSAITPDSAFQDNIAKAAEYGMDTGVYFFSQASTIEEAQEEARYVLQMIEPYTIAYPVVFDMEFIDESDEVRNLSRQEKTDIADAYCQIIQDAGYTAMIYGSASWLRDEIDMAQLLDYKFWMASYSDTVAFPYTFSMWQYTNKGSVDGIEGNADINLLMIPR